MARSERRGLFALRVAGVACALMLVVGLFHAVNLERVLALIASVGVGGVVLIAVPQALSALCDCLGWQQVFAILKHPVGLGSLLRVRIATEAVSQTLPLGAVWSESLKPGLLARHAQLATSRGVAGAVARRYLLIASQVPYTLLCALCGAGALRAISRHFLHNSWLLAVPWIAIVVLLAAALGLAGASAKGRIAERLHAVLSLIPSEPLRSFLARVRPQFTRSDELVAGYFKTPFTVSTVRPGFLLFLGWLCESVEALLILRLLGVELDFASVLAIEGSLAFLRNVAFVLPGGLGVQELGYAACLSALGVPDALTASAAFSLLRRAKELLWASAGYGLLFWDLRERSIRVMDRVGAEPSI